MKNSDIFSKHIDPYDTIIQLVEFANTTNINMQKIQAEMQLYDHRITALEAVIAEMIKQNELDRQR